MADEPEVNSDVLCTAGNWWVSGLILEKPLKNCRFSNYPKSRNRRMGAEEFYTQHNGFGGKLKRKNISCQPRRK